MIEKNSNKIKENINCDVSDEIIDFSLKNHMSAVFSDFVENSMKNTCKRMARSIFMLIVGGCLGIAICAITLILFIKFFGIKNGWIHNGIVSYISKLTGDDRVSIGSTEVEFKNGAFNIALKNVKIRKFKIPQMNIIPSFVKSMLSRKLSVHAIELCNSNIELAISNKTGNVFIKNYFSNKSDKLKYIPILQLSRKFNLDAGSINYRLKNSSVIIRKGYDNFKLSNVSGALDGRNFKIMNANFSAMLGDSNVLFGIKEFDNKNLITASLKKVNSDSLIKYINDKKLNQFAPLVNFLSIVNSDNISGTISFILDNDNILNSGKIKLSVENGLVSAKIGRNLAFDRPIRHIKKAEVIGRFDRDSLHINNLFAQFNNSKLKVAGVTLKNNNICNIDGTLELTNVSKTELNMLPPSISDACRVLFKDNLTNFTLPTLKMDIKTITSKRSSTPDYIISHGKFEMRDGILPLADKIINNVYASGEIVDDTIKLTLHSAKLENMNIKGGTLTIKDFGNNWSGTINTVLSADSFIKQLNIFKKCSIPFDKFILSDDVSCELSIVNDTHDKDRGFKIVSGQGTLLSGKQQINVKWDQNNAYISGSAETKSNRKVDVNISMNLKNNTGEKRLVVDSDNDVVASINEIIAATLNGKYKIVILEKWNGARGTYDINADLNGTLLTLPVFGNIKTKNQPGTISATATIDGNILTFNSINIDTNDKHIQGTMVINRETNEIMSCNFADKSVRDSGSMLSIKQADENTIKMNVIGSYLDISSIWNIISNMNKTFVVSMRINQAKISDTRSVRQLKGRLTIRNGHIIGGAAYCALLDGSSVIMESSLADANSSIINLNISNAGQFFKDLNVTNSVIGGRLKINIASDLRGKDNVRAINCELSDILVKNNETLAKIASLSTSNNIDLKNFSVGFNGVVCSLTMKNDAIMITDGKAIGPMLCLSFNGIYNKHDDELKLDGIAVPVSGYTTMGGQATYSPYSLLGSIFENRKTDISVNPMVMTDHNILQGLFGMKINVERDMFSPSTPTLQRLNELHQPIAVEEIKPISSPEIREEKYIKQPIDLDKIKAPAKVKVDAPKKRIKKVSKDRDLGITITRGA